MEVVRETWSKKIDFLMACIGFSVGLGNVWRFPYLCYKNGGGAFLIPYFISVIVGGIPIFFLEVAIGQFMSKGGIEVWEICPLFKGIGYASGIVVFYLNCYYNVILAWAIYYLFHSFNRVLPWSHCNNEWNKNESCAQSSRQSGNLSLAASLASNTSLNSTTKVDSVTEFWEYKVLEISNGIDNVGSVKWDLALCLLLMWIIVYFCIWKGIKTSGKVMYFTATSPYVFMLVLLIRAATLPGAYTGVKYYLYTDFSKLSDLKVWTDAGTQIFFSYSIGLGTLTALGSFNKFNHNSFKDCLIFSAVNSGTSFFAGFVIFMTLGYMAHVTGETDMSKVAEKGPGLAFVAYPKALAEMPFAPFWSVCFFLMIILLGLDSQFVGVEGFVTAISDVFPNFMKKGYNRQIFIASVCLISYCIGLSMVTNGGMYVFQLFDYFTGSRIILVVAFMECIVISYIYGAERFHENLKMMFGFVIPVALKYIWMLLSPIFSISMFVMSAIAYKDFTYEKGSTKTIYYFPQWAIVVGWLVASSSVVMIPLYMLVAFFRKDVNGAVCQRLRQLMRPRLRRHQLRACDSLSDLVEEDRNSVPLLEEKCASVQCVPLKSEDQA